MFYLGFRLFQCNVGARKKLNLKLNSTVSSSLSPIGDIVCQLVLLANQG